MTALQRACEGVFVIVFEARSTITGAVDAFVMKPDGAQAGLAYRLHASLRQGFRCRQSGQIF